MYLPSYLFCPNSHYYFVRLRGNRPGVHKMSHPTLTVGWPSVVRSPKKPSSCQKTTRPHSDFDLDSQNMEPVVLTLHSMGSILRLSLVRTVYSTYTRTRVPLEPASFGCVGANSLSSPYGPSSVNTTYSTCPPSSRCTAEVEKRFLRNAAPQK